MGKTERKNKAYSAEFKISVIMDMRENFLGYRETVRKYWGTQNRYEEELYKGTVKKWERIYARSSLLRERKSRLSQSQTESLSLMNSSLKNTIHTLLSTTLQKN